MKFTLSLIAIVIYALFTNYVFNHLDAWAAIIIGIVGILILLRIFKHLLNKHLNNQ